MLRCKLVLGVNHVEIMFLYFPRKVNIFSYIFQRKLIRNEFVDKNEHWVKSEDAIKNVDLE